MSALANDYCEQIKKHFKVLHAAFLPNEPMVLGDFGVMDDDVFIRLGNVAQFGVTFKAVQGTAPAAIDFASEGSVDIEFHAGGSIPGVKASVELRFNRKHAVFFNAAGCTSSSIADQVTFGEAIKKLIKAGSWQRKYVVVTTLVAAAATTAVASASKDATLVLEAESDAIPFVNLTDASLKLAIKRTKNISLKVVTSDKCTPLMGLSALRGIDFEPDAFGPLRGFSIGTELMAPAEVEDRLVPVR